MHGPDPLIEGKQMAFEAQIREHMKELGEEGHGHATVPIHKDGGEGTAAAAAAVAVMERARQGLKALGRKVGAWTAAGAPVNNPPPAVGEVGESGGVELWRPLAVLRLICLSHSPYACTHSGGLRRPRVGVGAGHEGVHRGGGPGAFCI